MTISEILWSIMLTDRLSTYELSVYFGLLWFVIAFLKKA